MDDILKRYIDKVLEIQSQRDRLSDSELREIARDIGLSEQDLEAIDQNIERTVQRANGFMTHSIWGNAIAEWKQVLILSPNQKNARAKLAYCYMHSGDKSQARTFAEDALKSDPSNALAFEVLGAIAQRTSGKGISTIYTVVGALVVLVLMSGIGAAILIVISDGEILAPWGTTSKELSRTLMEDRSRSVSPKINQKELKVRVNRIANDTVGFPIKVDLPPGLKFEAHLSKYDVYKDKSYYKLIGKIENRTRSEISQLQGTLTYHLSDGNSVQDVIDLHPTHRAILRPSDSAYFQEIQKISNTTLSSVSLKVAILASSPASRAYPKSKEIVFKWAEGISKTRYKIAIFERQSSLGSASSFGQYHKATWEFNNLGQPIRKLKINVTYFSKENAQLEEKFVYVTTSNATPIPQNETRNANTITKLPVGKFHHYALKVVEIE